jgi:putative inorganic carbon (hco3(-)) transporter
MKRGAFCVSWCPSTVRGSDGRRARSASSPRFFGGDDRQLIDRTRAVARRLVRFELGVVAILVIASLVSSRLLLPAIILTSAFWLVRWLTDGRLSVLTPGDWAILLLVLMLPVTLWATPLPDVTRTQVYQLLLGILFYYAVANWATSSIRLQWIIGGFMVASLALVLLAPFTVYLKHGGPTLTLFDVFQRRLPPTLSDTINPNILAGTLVVLLSFVGGLLLFGWRELRWPARALGGGAALSMTLVLLLAESRGALMALAVASIVLIMLRWRHGWVAVPAALLAGGLVAWRIGLERVINTLAATETVSGLDMRLEIWSRALYMIQDFPFAGVGMGGFGRVANLLYPFFLSNPDARIPHAHNLFLQIAVDLGLPGLVAWTALLLLVFVAAWSVYRRGRALGGAWIAGLGAGLLCSQVALAVHGLTDAVTWGARPAVIVWGLWALAMAALRLYSEV